VACTVSVWLVVMSSQPDGDACCAGAVRGERQVPVLVNLGAGRGARGTCSIRGDVVGLERALPPDARRTHDEVGHSRRRPAGRACQQDQSTDGTNARLLSPCRPLGTIERAGRKLTNCPTAADHLSSDLSCMMDGRWAALLP
jgi:hypothetical protein